MKRLWGPILAVALLPVALAITAAPVAAAPGVATFAMQSFRSSVVDPASGRVFVSGDSKIEVFTASGTPETTISGLDEPSGMAISGGSLYVVEQGLDRVRRLALSSFATTEVYPLGAVPYDTLVVRDGAAYLPASEDVGGALTLRRLDLSTKVVTDLGIGVVRVAPIPGSTTDLLGFDPGTSAFTIERIRVEDDGATVEASAPWGAGGFPSDVEATGDGIVVAAGARDPFTELREATLSPNGVRRAATQSDGGYMTNGVAFASANGGVFAGTSGQSYRVLRVFRPGVPIPSHTVDLGFRAKEASVQLAPDASAAYVVTDGVSGGTMNLITRSLSTALTDVEPSVVVAGVPTMLTLSGPGVPGADSVLVDGVAVPLVREAPTDVEVTVTAPLSATDLDIEVQTPTGSVSTTIDVAPNTGGGIAGRIRDAGVGVANAQVTITGPSLPDAKSTTSNADGEYAFAGLALGHSYVVNVIADDGRTTSSGPIDVRPNAVMSVDLNLDVPWLSSVLRSSYFGHFPPRDLLVEPTSGRVILTAANAVDVFEADGRPVTTFGDMWGASGLAHVDGLVYAVLQLSGEVVEIDPTIPAVTRRYPVGRVVQDTIAATDEAIALISDSYDRAENEILRVDRATGAVSSTPCGFCHAAHLVPIDGGDTSQFLAVSYTGGSVGTWDATDAPPTLAAFKSSMPGSLGPWAASATADRMWSARGDERGLTTHTDTGLNYDIKVAPKDVAHAAGTGNHNDVLALASAVFVAGNPTRSHELSYYGWPEAIALNPTGDRAYVAAGESLSVHDLHPRLMATDPRPVYTPGPTEFSGSGLGIIDSVVLDGTTELAAQSLSPNEMEVDLPRLALGSHTLEVTTPWGTTAPFEFRVVNPPAPIVTSFWPQHLSSVETTTVELTGRAFVDVEQVLVGEDSVPFEVIDPRTISIDVPPVEVTDYRDDRITVISAWGSGSPHGALNRVPRSTFTGANPSAGPGGMIEITGTRVDEVHSVTVDGDEVPFSPSSATKLIVDIPPDVAGRSVEIEGTNGLDPTGVVTYTFTDQTGDPTPPALVDVVSVNASYVPLGGDFTGDGVDDVFWYAPGPAADSMWRFEPDGRFTSSAQSVNGTYRPIVGDFTGDGVDDIFWYAPGSGSDSIWDFNPGGGRTTRAVTQPGLFTPVAGDFTGDGVDDIFWYAPGTARDALWDFNRGGGRTSTTFVVSSSSYRPLAGDLTGDGVDDIAWYAAGTAADSIWDFNPGGGRTTRPLKVNGTYTPVAGDFTGDDVDDVLWYAPGSGVDSLWDFTSGGDHTSAVLTIPGSPRLAAADLTGGGVTDLVLHGPGSATDLLWFMAPVIR